jgi:hypothetical protein
MNWLAKPENQAHLLALAEEVRATGKPLGCWCGFWQAGEPLLLCHAVVLAQAVDLILSEELPP